MKSLALAVITAFCSLAAAADWSLVWSDEFDQPEGAAPDATKWVFDLGGNGWGNNELQTYTSRTNNARIEDGNLVIEARKENFTGTDGIARGYTSARLKTKERASWTYGRMEARIKIPRGKGLWPAFWMMGTNVETVHWPSCGEIDIMENIGSELSKVYGTIHGPGYSGSGGIGDNCTLVNGGAFADDFHRFAIEWETNCLRWYVDDQLYFTANPASLPSGSTWVYTQPQFILLNLAVGGNWPGSPDSSTVFPQRLAIDYVRVYAGTNSPAACGPNLLPNPGFEVNGIDSWSAYGAGFNTLIGHRPDLPVFAGSNVFKVFGQFNSVENYSGVFRDTPVSAGANLAATAEALTPEGDSLAEGNTAWIEVSFRDAGADILSLYRSPVLDNSTTAGVWQHLAVTNRLNPLTYAVVGSNHVLVAPAGTSFARYQVVFRQPNNAAGAVLFDDLILQRVSAANLPVRSSALRAGNHLVIAFPSYLGLDYQVRYKEDLRDDTWQVLTNLAGDGTTRAVNAALSGNHRFYQVVRLCN